MPLSQLEEVVLKSDEIEAIRLADLNELYHENAAAKMRISRQTFGRILNTAHKKLAKALLEGLVLRLDANPQGENHENLCSCKKQQRPSE